MQVLLKISICILIFMTTSQVNYAQVACCAKGSKASANCASKAKTSEKQTTKACCASKSKETTSGCTPSNCRGAKTKFGEAKVISNLRLELISLKAKMENSKKLKFSESSISVHDIIGETDDESLDIIVNQVAMIESEIGTVTNRIIKSPRIPKNKAKRVKQMKERISILSNIL